MRIIAILVLLVGAAVAGGAVYLMLERERVLAEQMAAQQQKAPEAPKIETVDVVVATKRLRYGAVLKDDTVRVVPYTKDAVPPNSFTSLEALLGDGSPNNQRIVLRAMEPGEPVLSNKVTGFGERPTISTQLTPGMRAFTLRIDAVTGVAGFLLPNDRVDIFLTTGSRDGLKSNVIMQNVKVIAVDQLADQDARLARVSRTATVEVAPQDAQKLALAQQMGRISLSLRQIDETTTSEETEAVDIGDIIKQEEAAAPAPAPKQICVRKGTERICE